MNRWREERRAALAAVSSAAGMAFSTGREIVFFFSQTGFLSWLGILIASALFGAMCGITAHAAGEIGTKRLTCVYKTLTGGAACVTLGLMMAVISLVMIFRVGAMAALTLPVTNAFPIGILVSLIVALLLNMHRGHAAPLLGSLVVYGCALFYAALALDGREVTVYLDVPVIAHLDDCLTVTIVLALFHASMSAVLAGGASARFAGETARIKRFSAYCGLYMLLVLAAGNGAILRGGSRLLAQKMPLVILLARWGKAGYYLSAAMLWSCCTATLTASVGILTELVSNANCSIMMTKTRVKL